MTGRILITGDLHGTLTPLFGLAEKNKLQDTDVLIIAGDAGFVWDEDYPYRVKTLGQIFPGQIAFVDGNHENHALLNSMEVRSWNGGRVHQVGERMVHLMRGELYSVYGNRIFAFGGARSVDRDQREDGRSWWREEEPTPAEEDYGQAQLMEHLHEIQYVITHETPLCARAAISRSKPVDGDYRLPALLETWYQLLKDAPDFRQWYFGHMHTDQRITSRLRGVHHHFLLLGQEERLPWV